MRADWDLLAKNCSYADWKYLSTLVGSKNSTVQREKLRKKYVNRNIILGSQKQSIAVFDVDMSQQKHSVTTFNSKVELVTITMKPCETFHSLVTCQSLK